MKQMRRAERRKDSQWAMEVFDKAPFTTLCMTRPDGTPYAVPLNIVRKNDTVFYFHCAFEGEKIDCLRHNPIVSIMAVSRCTPKYEEEKNNFTEYFNSAIAIGKAERVDDDQEKIEALRLICKRFLPKYMDHFDQAISRSLHRTNVIRITLTEPPVGKSKP